VIEARRSPAQYLGAAKATKSGDDSLILLKKLSIQQKMVIFAG
jgi:hypothetical protein